MAGVEGSRGRIRGDEGKKRMGAECSRAMGRTWHFILRAMEAIESSEPRRDLADSGVHRHPWPLGATMAETRRPGQSQ